MKRLLSENVLPVLKKFWEASSRNVVLKVVSFALALIIWGYVISTDTSITRTVTLTGLTGYVSGRNSLTSNSLALYDDAESALKDITVEIEVPQASYATVSNSNVQVSLDVSNVRATGVQSVPINATSAIGTVTAVYPSSIDLTFEVLDSRSVPVSVIPENTVEGYWYSVIRTNPQQITVSGPTSLVRSVARAVVRADMTGIVSPFTKANSYTLLDSNDNEIDTKLLTTTVSSVTVTTDVYPTKTVGVANTTSEVLIGSVAPGYIIESIIIQPSEIVVAADQSLLDSIDKLAIEPLEIDEPSQTFTKSAPIVKLSNIKYYSAEEVYVTVQIAEETMSTWIENIPITYIGLSESLKLTAKRDSVSLYISGPRSAVLDAVASPPSVICDLSGLEAGTHDAALEIDLTNYSTLLAEAETDIAHIMLEELPDVSEESEDNQ